MTSTLYMSKQGVTFKFVSPFIDSLVYEKNNVNL